MVVAFSHKYYKFYTLAFRRLLILSLQITAAFPVTRRAQVERLLNTLCLSITDLVVFVVLLRCKQIIQFSNLVQQFISMETQEQKTGIMDKQVTKMV